MRADGLGQAADSDYLTDAGLIEAARNGDERAWWLLVRRTEPYVRGAARRCLGPGAPGADVDDATAFAFQQAFRKIGDVRDPGAFRSWVARTAAREAVRIAEDTRRREQRAREIQASPEWGAARPEGGVRYHDAGDPAPNKRALVHDILEHLEVGAPKHAALVRGYLVTQDAGRALAQDLGIPESLIDQRWSAAKKKFVETGLAMLVARQGRDSCPVLAAILASAEKSKAPVLPVREINRHLRDCEACAPARRRAAGQMLTLPPLLIVPEWLRDRLVADSERVTGRRRRDRATGAPARLSTGSSRRRAPVRPPGTMPGRRRPRRFGAALATTALLAAVLLLVPDLRGSIDATLIPSGTGESLPPGATASPSAAGPSPSRGPAATATPPGAATQTASETPSGSAHPSAPVVVVDLSVDGEMAPAKVSVDASVDGAARASFQYTFDFGDGQVTGPEAASHAVHMYTEAGEYTITVTASAGFGRSGVGTADVSVRPGASASSSASPSPVPAPLTSPQLESPDDGAVGTRTEWTLTWDAVPGATSYSVDLECQCDPDSDAWTPKGGPSTTGTSITVSLQSRITWRWQVTAFDATQPDGVSSGWRKIKVNELIK